MLFLASIAGLLAPKFDLTIESIVAKTDDECLRVFDLFERTIGSRRPKP